MLVSTWRNSSQWVQWVCQQGVYIRSSKVLPVAGDAGLLQLLHIQHCETGQLHDFINLFTSVNIQTCSPHIYRSNEPNYQQVRLLHEHRKHSATDIIIARLSKYILTLAKKLSHESASMSVSSYEMSFRVSEYCGEDEL